MKKKESGEQGPGMWRWKCRGVILFFALCSFAAKASGTWTQKINFTGMARYGMVNFVIGNYAYTGLGWDGNAYHKDFWKYDPSGDSWSQVADLAGPPRNGASAFSVGNKGYAGTGLDVNTVYKDMYEYDPAVNSWTAKTDFPGAQRYAASSSATGTKGYLGLGTSGSSGPFYNDWWEYDPASDTWTQRASYPGAARSGAASFMISHCIYLCAGSNVSTSSYYNDLWKFDPAANTWMQQAVMPGPPRTGGNGFSVNNLGYFGLGKNYDTGVCYNDLWKYDPLHDTWSQQTSFPGSARWAAAAFTIGIKAYICAGITANGTLKNDNWQWCPSPPQPFALYGPSTLCSGTTDVFSCSTVPGASSYYWTLPTGWTGTSITNSITVTAGDSSGYLTANAVNACGSGNVQYFTVSVEPAPPVPVIAVNGNALTSSSVSGNQWFLNGNPINGATASSYIPVQNGTYSVCVTGTNACSSCSDPLQYSSVGIQDPATDHSLAIFVSETPGIFTVIQDEFSRLKIFDQQGKVVLEVLLQKNVSEIDMSTQAKGIYLAEFSNDKSKQVRKIIIN